MKSRKLVTYDMPAELFHYYTNKRILSNTHSTVRHKRCSALKSCTDLRRSVLIFSLRVEPAKSGSYDEYRTENHQCKETSYSGFCRLRYDHRHFYIIWHLSPHTNYFSHFSFFTKFEILLFFALFILIVFVLVTLIILKQKNDLIIFKSFQIQICL